MKKSSRNSRPSKPYPDFPLYAHGNGRWAKRIRGKIHYFGRWAADREGKAALEQYKRERDDLHAGRTPTTRADGLTVKELCDHFCHVKQARVESGELSPVSFRDYHLTCLRVADFFGRTRFVEDLRAEDFDQFRAHLAKTNGLVGIRNNVAMTRMLFLYAYKAGLIERPINFGPNFTKPTAKAIRKKRMPRMFEAEEIHRLLDGAAPTIKAMILLGVNCGFGCADVGRLPQSALDLQTGWVTFPRPKTGAFRRVPLWPETIEAIRDALDQRPRPKSKEAQDLMFVTRWGGSWHKDSTRYLTEQFGKLLKTLDADAASKSAAEGTTAPEKLYRRGRGFYTLRHVFETIGGESRDQVAVDAIMGHERGDMASNYRERISDERLRAVVNVVHEWLFTAGAQAEEEEPAIVKFRPVG